MAPRALKAGLVSLCCYSVAYGTGPYLEGSLYCRTLACTLAGATAEAGCPAGDCTWTASKSTCDPSMNLMLSLGSISSMTALYGTSSPYGRFFQKLDGCQQQKDQAACSGDCAWDASRSSCGPSASLASAPELQPMNICMSKRTQQDCESSSCRWAKDPMMNLTACFPSKADTMPLYGCTSTATPYAPPTTAAPSASTDSIHCRMLQCMYANSEANKQATCSRGECVWNSQMSSCMSSETLLRAHMDASMSSNQTLMFGRKGPYARYLTQQDICSKTAQASCSGPCEWDQSRSRCDQSRDLIMEFLNAYARDMEELSNCSSARRTEQAAEECQRAGCIWSTGSMTGCYAKQATMYKLYGCDAAAAANAAATTTKAATTTREGAVSTAAPELRASTAAAASVALWAGAWAAGKA